MTPRLSRLSLALFLPLLLAASLIFVTKTQAGTPPDICESTCAYSTIQEAVSTHEPDGDTLVIAAETFSETVEITRSMTLVGAGAGATIIDGNAFGTVILVTEEVEEVIVSISGVTIQNGDSTSVDGGGLLVFSSCVGDILLVSSLNSGGILVAFQWQLGRHQVASGW